MHVARWIIALVAAANYLGPLVDGVIPATARQHLRNPHWPPHARFHNAQTMMIGVLNGTIALVVLFSGALPERAALLVSAAVAVSYYLAMILASFLPGTGWTDPEFAAETPRPLGLAPQQLLTYLLCGLTVVAVVLVLAGG